MSLLQLSLLWICLPRAWSNRSEWTLRCSQMRSGSAASVGPPVTCLASPAPVLLPRWFVCTTPRISARVLIPTWHSREFLKHQSHLQFFLDAVLLNNLGNNFSVSSYRRGFYPKWHNVLFLSCAATSLHWMSCTIWWRQWSIVHNRIKSGFLIFRRLWRRRKTRKKVSKKKHTEQLQKKAIHAPLAASLKILIWFHFLFHFEFKYVPRFPIVLVHVFIIWFIYCNCQCLFFFFCSGLEELHGLIEQAETKMFPRNSFLKQLQEVTAEADKVAAMAQQLLNGKRQTRYKNKHSVDISGTYTVHQPCGFVVYIKS